jgi:GNAT superfamily N-acetyltransferase
MKPSIQIRPLTTGDLRRCEAVERQAVSPPGGWSLDSFEAFFGCLGHGGYLAEWYDQPLGYLLYQADREHRRLYLGRIQVVESWRRRTIGSRLVQHVRQWLRPVPDIQMCAVVHESCLPLQCFLRANGFLAVRIFRGRFDGGDRDAYLFEAAVGERSPLVRG